MMRTISFLCLMIAIVLAPANCLWAVGRVNVDPNVTGVQTAADSSDIATKLEQKAAYQAEQKSVSSILSDLSVLSGIKFQAGINKNDWQVRDRKMVILAKDTPLVDLMNSIARVMNFKWKRTEDKGTWTYLLYMDRKAILDSSLRCEREETKRNESRQKVLDESAQDAELSEEDLAKLKEADPARYLYSEMGFSNFFKKFVSESSAAANAFATGDVAVVNASQLSASTKEAMRQFLLNLLATAYDGQNLSELVERVNDVDNVYIHVNRNSIRMCPSYVLGVLSFTDDESNGICGLPITDPNSRTGQVAAEIGTQALEEERPVTSEEEQAIEKATEVDDKAIETLEPKVDHTDGLTPDPKIKLSVTNGTLADVQDAVSEATGFAVVSDSFVSNSKKISIVSDEIELTSVLNMIQNTYNYNWTKKGSTLEFQDRDWVRKRRVQIPDAWVDCWREALMKDGYLNISYLAQLAMLEPDQLSENISDDSVLGDTTLTDTVTDNRSLLRFYAALSASERRALSSPKGLALSNLDPSKQTAVTALLSGYPSTLLQDDNEFVVAVSSSQTLDQHIYTFKITSADGQTIITSQVVAPSWKKSKEPTAKSCSGSVQHNNDTLQGENK
ncbi:hypothetical protein LLG46_05315 [bacterium]|nr:hypothetical protein [bacterium]